MSNTRVPKADDVLRTMLNTKPAPRIAKPKKAKKAKKAKKKG